MLLIIFATVLGLVATMSAIGKLRGMPQVKAMLHHVGLGDGQIKGLAVIELLGALGLLVGIWVPILGLLAAIGLALYFLGAVIAHLRVKDAPKDAAPALILMILAIVTVGLELIR